jgi:hypothetical protein
MKRTSIWLAVGVGLAMMPGFGTTAHSQQEAGAAFGAREPRACPPRKFAGAPTAEQARALFICDLEKYNVGHGYLYLASDVVVEIGKSRPYSRSDSGPTDIDVSARVYPIQGNFTTYQCSRRDAMLGQDPNRNCLVTVFSQATGTCYTSTFGEWHCGMISGAGTTVTQLEAFQSPPKGP